MEDQDFSQVPELFLDAPIKMHFDPPSQIFEKTGIVIARRAAPWQSSAAHCPEGGEGFSGSQERSFDSPSAISGRLASESDCFASLAMTGHRDFCEHSPQKNPRTDVFNRSGDFPFLSSRSWKGLSPRRQLHKVQAGLLASSPFQRPSHSQEQWRTMAERVPFRERERLQRRDRPRFARGSLLSPSGHLNLTRGVSKKKRR